MMIISFGWTWPALLAEGVFQKTVTRRNWTRGYAKLFRKGQVCKPYDRSPRFKGKQIKDGDGRDLYIRLTDDPYIEPISQMPDEDFFREGFAYLDCNRNLLPKSMPIDVSPAGFDAWRKSGQELWVIRVEKVMKEEGVYVAYTS